MQTTIASAVEEQTATPNEIARSVGEAAHGSARIAESITSVAVAAADTSAGAARTRAAAGALHTVAAGLQRLVDGGGPGELSSRPVDLAVPAASSIDESPLAVVR